MSLNCRGLRAGETARFEEARRLCGALVKNKPKEQCALWAVWECVQSMPVEARDEVLQELRGILPSFEVTGIDVRGVSWCRRPRYFWTNFFVSSFEEETEFWRQGHAIWSSARSFHPSRVCWRTGTFQRGRRRT